MTVKDYMQHQLITVSPEESVKTVYQRMQQNHIRHVPVVTGQGMLVGLVTDRDIRQARASDDPHLVEYELGYLLEKMTVQDVMTPTPVTVRGDTPISEAGRLLVEKKFGCLPVVTDNNTLQGILTVTDILRAYVAPGAGQ